MKHWLRSVALIFAIALFTAAAKTEGPSDWQWWVTLLASGIFFGIFNDMVPDKVKNDK